MSVSIKQLEKYLEFKKSVPETILFIKSGIFYRAYQEDAKIASKIFDIKLMISGDACAPIVLCGFPIKAVEKYIGKAARTIPAIAFVDLVYDSYNIEVIKFERRTENYKN